MSQYRVGALEVGIRNLHQDALCAFHARANAVAQPRHNRRCQSLSLSELGPGDWLKRSDLTIYRLSRYGFAQRGRAKVGVEARVARPQKMRGTVSTSLSRAVLLLTLRCRRTSHALA